MLLHKTIFETMPGVPGFWSEPRHADLEKVFARTWREMVPGEGALWDIKIKDGLKSLYVNTSPVTVVDLVSRNVDNPGKKVGIGPNYGYGFVDEGAEKFDIRRWNDLKNSIRRKDAPFRFLDSLSTPVKNGYYNLCTREGARVIHSSSYDNPFIPREAIDDMVADMSDDYVAQEIHGKWISHEGRVWNNFSEAEWPAGNMHWAKWNPRQPWYLGFDIGQGLGHWQIWQYHDAVDRHGDRQYTGKIAVVVAEGLQRNQMFQTTLNFIKDNYATKLNPVKVAIGHDVGTLAMTGPAPKNYLTQLGWKYWFPQNEQTDKALQGQALSRLILDTTGGRRFCVSKNIKREGPSRELWGVVNCMLNDTFPEPGSSAGWFRKEKRASGISNVEDPRDSTLYMTMMQHPPKWVRHTRHAA